MEIYILDGQEQKGPYTLPDLMQRVAQGQLAEDVWAWHEGLSDWIPLHQLSNTDSSPIEDPRDLQPVAIPPPLPKTAVNQWYDNVFVIAPCVLLCYPFGLIPLWLTKNYSTKVKGGITIGISVFYLFVILASPESAARGKDTQAASKEAVGDSWRHEQLASLRKIGANVFGVQEFGGVEMTILDDGPEGSLADLSVTSREANVEARAVCQRLIEFFQEATKKGALRQIGHITFHFRATVIWSDGEEQELELLRIGMAREHFGRVQWDNFDKYLNHELFKHHLLRNNDDFYMFSPSRYEWTGKGWSD